MGELYADDAEAIGKFLRGFDALTESVSLGFGPFEIFSDGEPIGHVELADGGTAYVFKADG